jgi:hypothetical protein
VRRCPDRRNCPRPFRTGPTNALAISDSRFHYDLDQLITAVDRSMELDATLLAAVWRMPNQQLPAPSAYDRAFRRARRSRMTLVASRRLGCSSALSLCSCTRMRARSRRYKVLPKRNRCSHVPSTTSGRGVAQNCVSSEAVQEAAIWALRPAQNGRTPVREWAGRLEGPECGYPLVRAAAKQRPPRRQAAVSDSLRR